MPPDTLRDIATDGRRATGVRAFLTALALAFLVNFACDRQPAARTEAPPATAAPNDPWFEDVARQAGVDFTHVRGLEIRYWFPEIMSGGAAFLDYDDDGHLDLYLVQGGDLDPARSDRPGNVLLRNRGDGTFEDVTATAGVGDTGYGMGCTVGDFNGDGSPDLYVTNVGPNVLYRNNGDGTFADVTRETGVGDPGWSSSAAFVDYDRDGDLDLFVVNYINWSVERELPCAAGDGRRDYCKPTNYNAPAPDTLYRNDDGRFTDVSDAAGLRRAFGNGLGVACADFNLDGRVDIYVANDGMPNQLWINRGEGTFSDEALLSGCALNMHGMAEAGMGVQAVDADNDGDIDLLLTHLRDEQNTFYLNTNGMFEDRTPMTGLTAASLPFTGFGMAFADFNLDGFLDLYVANGRVGIWEPGWDPADPYAEPNQVFRGRPDGKFDEISPRGGTAEVLLGTSRGAAFGDYDNDGDIDAVVIESGGKARLLRNVAPRRGAWIMFRVLNARGADAVGARVRITAAGRTLWRTVDPAYSYCSANDARVHFGLGPANGADDVSVLWPDGRSQSFGPLPAGRLHVLQRKTLATRAQPPPAHRE